MVKTKRKSILRTLLCAVFALCFAVGLSSLFASGTTAYAATTPKYTVKFNWSTKTTTGTGGGTGGNTASGSGVSYSMQTGQLSILAEKEYKSPSQAPIIKRNVLLSVCIP